MEGYCVIPDDPTGVNQLFAGFEATAGASGSDCADCAAALAGDLYRLMMLDENLLAFSLSSHCDQRPRHAA